MPNLKLTDLVTLSGSQLTGDDFLYIVENTTNTSRKITFDSLANTRLNTLSAYDLDNTTNIDFLSSRISDNTTRIDSGDTIDTGITNDINFLSGAIGENITDILTVSASVVNNSLGTLGSDVLTISGDVQALSSLARENEELITGGAADFTFLSGEINTNIANIGTIGSLATTSSNLVGAVNELHTEIDTNTSSINDNTINIANIRTLSGFSGTVTTASVTQTKHVNIIIGTTTYKLLLAD